MTSRRMQLLYWNSSAGCGRSIMKCSACPGAGARKRGCGRAPSQTSADESRAARLLPVLR